jgi:hypothetical protein
VWDIPHKPGVPAVGGGARGKAVQVDPIKLTSKAPGTKRLKRTSDELLSNFAFNFNLRRYNTVNYAVLALNKFGFGMVFLAGAYTRPLFSSS